MARDKWTEQAALEILTNPYYAVTINPAFCQAHEPIVTEEAWIAANVQAIGEIGADAWLRGLLSTLKGDNR